VAKLHSLDENPVSKGVQRPGLRRFAGVTQVALAEEIHARTGLGTGTRYRGIIHVEDRVHRSSFSLQLAGLEKGLSVPLGSNKEICSQQRV
jgi:hypothetical protein